MPWLGNTRSWEEHRLRQPCHCMHSTHFRPGNRQAICFRYHYVIQQGSGTTSFTQLWCRACRRIRTDMIRGDLHFLPRASGPGYAWSEFRRQILVLPRSTTDHTLYDYHHITHSRPSRPITQCLPFLSLETTSRSSRIRLNRSSS